jgi:Tol biopolymer transport system component
MMPSCARHLLALLAIIIVSGCGKRVSLPQAAQKKAVADKAALAQARFEDQRREAKRSSGAPTLASNQPAAPGARPSHALPSTKAAKCVRLVSREVSLGMRHRGAVVESILVSPDGQSVAYKCVRGAKWIIVKDGKEGDEYDDGYCNTPLGPASHRVGGLLFSPDGKRLAYWAKKAGRELIVVDGVEHEVGGRFDRNTFVFSPSSRHFAFVAMVGNHRAFSQPAQVITDQAKGKVYDGIGHQSLAFSQDGTRLAYIASKRKGNRRQDESTFLVVDGIESAADRHVESQLVFSPDGKRLAYLASRQGKQLVVIGDKEIEDWAAAAPVFSPDGKHFAYIAYRNQRRNVILVLDGKETGLAYERPVFANRRVFQRSVLFNRDGSRVAFVVQNRQGSVVIINSREGKRYASCAEVRFSPDGGRVAYQATTGNGDYFVVTDDREGKPYSKIVKGSLVFSPDSRHSAFLATRDRKVVTVVDDVESEREQADEPLLPLVFHGPKHLHRITVKKGELFRLEIEVIRK